jgi:S-adenosyl methyltransferase
LNSEHGETAYVEGDITQPDSILNAPELHKTLDMDQPVALSVNAVFHFVPDDLDPYGIVAHLLEALPSGSALCLSHVTEDVDPQGVGRLVEVYTANGVATQARSRDEVARFFDGLNLLEPGITMAHKWRPEVRVPRPRNGEELPSEAPSDAEVSLWAGVALKP